jgi:hypothetical protein
LCQNVSFLQGSRLTYFLKYKPRRPCRTDPLFPSSHFIFI